MNKSKLFDKPQLLITIIGLSSLTTSLVIFIIMLFTSEKTFLENGEIDTITYNNALLAIYSIFACISILMLVWFFIRVFTYKLRIKETDIL